jgi:hypothetical protein
MEFYASYLVLPGPSLLVMSAWVTAAWLADVWDRFPHLAITSPEKRCGKTLLLDLLNVTVPRPRYTTNISPAALYRVVQLEKPTLLMDECQSISRRGSEASEVIREILNAGIGRNARVTRCGGANFDRIEEFSVYGPKVFAMIGEPDSVLADRCLPLPIARKRRGDRGRVQRYRSRQVEAAGKALHDSLEAWAAEHKEEVARVYDSLEPFDIDNDRMADLLTPLQAVLTVLGGGRPLEVLLQYAKGLDERDREQEMQSPGVRLLAACRELFPLGSFLPTETLLNCLIARRDEPWYRWNKGEPITADKLAGLLRPYNIRPVLNKKRTGRGYYADDFKEAWTRYLAPAYTSESPSNSSHSSNPSSYGGAPANAGPRHTTPTSRGATSDLAAMLAAQRNGDFR